MGRAFWGNLESAFDNDIAAYQYETDRYLADDDYLIQENQRKYFYFREVFQKALTPDDLFRVLHKICDNPEPPYLPSYRFFLEDHTLELPLSIRLERKRRNFDYDQSLKKVICEAFQNEIHSRGPVFEKDIDENKTLQSFIERIKPLTFGQKLGELKGRLEKTNIEFAFESEIGSSTFYAYQKGTRKPKKDVIFRAAMILELPLEDTLELLMLAGYTINVHDKRDMIIAYRLDRKEFNLDETNDILIQQKLKPLIEDNKV